MKKPARNIKKNRLYMNWDISIQHFPVLGIIIEEHIPIMIANRFWQFWRR